MRIQLPQLLWYGNTTLEIDLPDQWEVQFCPMCGAGRPPMSLAQMEAAVLDPDDITFVCALGTHGALTQNGLRKKLGVRILERYRVFNHNPYENCVALADRSGTMAVTVVVIANAPEGQVIHYLLGRFGRGYGGRQYPVTSIPSGVDLIIMAPHVDKTFGDWFANPEQIKWPHDWEATMEIIGPEFGSGTQVAVIPNATIQYYDN